MRKTCLREDHSDASRIVYLLLDYREIDRLWSLAWYLRSTLLVICRVKLKLIVDDELFGKTSIEERRTIYPPNWSPFINELTSDEQWSSPPNPLDWWLMIHSFIMNGINRINHRINQSISHLRPSSDRSSIKKIRTLFFQPRGKRISCRSLSQTHSQNSICIRYFTPVNSSGKLRHNRYHTYSISCLLRYIVDCGFRPSVDN